MFRFHTAKYPKPCKLALWYGFQLGCLLCLEFKPGSQMMTRIDKTIYREMQRTTQCVSWLSWKGMEENRLLAN